MDHQKKKNPLYLNFKNRMRGNKKSTTTQYASYCKELERLCFKKSRTKEDQLRISTLRHLIKELDSLK